MAEQGAWATMANQEAREATVPAPAPALAYTAGAILHPPKTKKQYFGKLTGLNWGSGALHGLPENQEPSVGKQELRSPPWAGLGNWVVLTWSRHWKALSRIWHWSILKGWSQHWSELWGWSRHWSELWDWSRHWSELWSWKEPHPAGLSEKRPANLTLEWPAGFSETRAAGLTEDLLTCWTAGWFWLWAGHSPDTGYPFPPE